MPEIVVRAATSGGQLWAVDLGAYGSRFDAERILLRAALAESSVLGGGVRRIEPRGSAHRALVVSLTEDQASRACARLTLTAQPCTVLAP
jgi:D-alanyl-D-alanine carboxypeptidase